MEKFSGASTGVGIVLALIAGCVMALQPMVNGRLAGQCGHPLQASIISFATGLLGGALPTDKSVYLPSFVFALVILVLLLRPAGLFARRRSALVDRV